MPKLKRLLLGLGLLLVAAAAARAQDAPLAPTPTAATAGRIARIEVIPGDVFDLAKEDNPLYRVANFLHIETRPHVVRRLLLFEEGDPYDPAVLAETERELRAQPAFRAASVTSKRRPDGDWDVVVRTEDKWSIRFGAGVGLVGGVGKARLDVGDSNLLGLGKVVRFAVIERTDRSIVRGEYFDPDIMGTRHQLALTAATGDLGTQFFGSMGLPFISREAPYAYELEALRETSDIEYFDEGEVDATIERELDRIELAGALGFGPRESVKRLALEVAFERASYAAPEGDDPFSIRWPRNRDTIDVVLVPSLDRFGRFEKLERLDAYEFVEDVAVGWEISARLGEQTRIDSRGERAEALAGAGATWSHRPTGDQIIVVDALWSMRHDGDRPQAYSLEAFYHHYARLGMWQTLAWNVDFIMVEEREDLTPQLTLGEDNGLRGYEARRFAGKRRLRANLEDRIFTPIELLSFHLGFVVFADAGLVWSDGERPRLDDVKPAVGFGFRVFSPELLKRTALRLDIAFPLDPEDGPGVSVSFTAGQVFTLFGQSNELAERF